MLAVEQAGESRRVIPKILFVHNPQTSKDAEMAQTGLLYFPEFAQAVDTFNGEARPFTGSALSMTNYAASICFSYGVFSTFERLLEEDLRKDENDQTSHQKLYTGNSIGEMGSLMSGGFPTKKMAELLAIRQDIQMHGPVGPGIRLMFAAVGMDADLVDKHVQDANHLWEGAMEAFRANDNTPKEVVYAVNIVKGGVQDAKAWLDKAFEGVSISPRWKLLPIDDGNHSPIMLPRELVFREAVRNLITDDQINEPTPYTIYSTMWSNWVNSKENVRTVINNQLTRRVAFSQGLLTLASTQHEIVAVMTADRTGIIPRKVVQNIGDLIPIVNIVDKQSLEDAVSKVSPLIRNWTT